MTDHVEWLQALATGGASVTHCRDGYVLSASQGALAAPALLGGLFGGLFGGGEEACRSSRRGRRRLTAYPPNAQPRTVPATRPCCRALPWGTSAAAYRPRVTRCSCSPCCASHVGEPTGCVQAPARPAADGVYPTSTASAPRALLQRRRVHILLPSPTPPLSRRARTHCQPPTAPVHVGICSTNSRCHSLPTPLHRPPSCTAAHEHIVPAPRPPPPRIHIGFTRSRCHSLPIFLLLLRALPELCREKIIRLYGGHAYFFSVSFRPGFFPCLRGSTRTSFGR